MLKSVPCEPYLVGRVVYEAPTKFHKKFIKPSFLSHGPLSFPVQLLGLENYTLGTSTFMVRLPFLP